MSCACSALDLCTPPDATVIALSLRSLLVGCYVSYYARDASSAPVAVPEVPSFTRRQAEASMARATVSYHSRVNFAVRRARAPRLTAEALFRYRECPLIHGRFP